MAAVGGSGRPNLKISIDNEEDGSSSDAEMVSNNEENSIYETGHESSAGEEAEISIEVDDDIAGEEEHDSDHGRHHASESDSDRSIDVHVDNSRTRRNKPLLGLGLVEEQKFSVVPPKDNEPRKYENRSGDFITGFDPTSKENVEKREQRAKRFGITRKTGAKISEEDIQKLYKSLGVTDLSLSERGIRLEAIHMRGVDDMSTQDIFKYFQEFSPGSVEWIDDASCNVTWLDKVTTARAMLALSKDPDEYSAEGDPDDEDDEEDMDTHTKEMKPTKDDRLKKEQESEEEYDDDLDLLSDDDDKKKDENTNSINNEKNTTSEKPDTSKTLTVDSESEEATREEAMKTSNSESSEVKLQKPSTRHPILPPAPQLAGLPPGRWRVAKLGPNRDQLYFRFATKADKKLPGAEKRSKYYMKYGNPNYGGIKGLLSEGRKRKIRAQKRWIESQNIIDERELEESHGREKVQYLDQDEEAVPDPEEWGVPTLPRSLQGRLTVEEPPSPPEERRASKRAKVSSSEEESEADEDLEKLLAPPVKKRYMRMYADDVEEEIKAKRENAATTKVAVDARSRIENRRRHKYIEEECSEDSAEADDDQDYSSSLKKCVDLRNKLRGQDSRHSHRLHKSASDAIRPRPKLTIQVQHE